jgi:phosphate-selective porin OprO and OprP
MHRYAIQIAFVAGLGLIGAARVSAQGREGRVPGDTARTVADDARLAARVSELEAAVNELLRRQGRLADSLTKTTRQAADANNPPLTFTSADGRFRLRLRGYFQSDSRFFFDGDNTPATGTFLLRRVRPIWEATVGRIVDLRLMPDFGEGRVTVFDAHADLRLSPLFNIRSGKFKPPVGLERLQSATDIIFIERAINTSFAPNRDIGVQLYGDISGGVVQYQAGVFNGVTDLGFGDGDGDDQKDFAARLFFEPFARSSIGALREFGFGIAGTRGGHHGTIAAPGLQTYRTPAQQAAFVFRSDGKATGTTIADGLHTRVAPQGYWYVNRLGTLWEYTRIGQLVRQGTTAQRLEHSAFNVTSSVSLTGEHPTYRGLTPNKPFDPQRHQWGAFELGFRYNRFSIDPDAFPIFADTSVQPQRADSRGVAFNWYLNRGVRLMVNYSVTRFRGGAAGGNREPERALQTRIQHSF